MADIRIATRASQLALAQSKLVGRALAAAHPGLAVELVTISTTGDRDRKTPVAALTEVGAFVRAVQYAVLDGAADIAVHSGKDLPVVGPDGLEAVHPERAAPWDVLCGASLHDLGPGAVIGTGSPRRAAQLRLLRPDVEVQEIRGNVDTRLAAVDTGRYDAIVLAEAGLARMGLENRIGHRFALRDMVPAAAQGALTVEARAASEVRTLLKAIDHGPTRTAVETERTVLRLSGAGCRAALGVLAVVGGSEVTATGFVADDRGPRREAATGVDPLSVGRALCDALEIVP